MKEGYEREPAVAGTFYPHAPSELRSAVRKYITSGEIKASTAQGKLRALIAPHAGYVFSGAIAGCAFATLQKDRQRIKRVVLMGPAHRLPFRGIAISRAESFITPLGKVSVDPKASEQLKQLTFVSTFEEAHLEEHGIEVQLPFLQEVLGEFALVPLIVGNATGEQVCKVLEALQAGDETLLVISSDLSHYLDDASARSVDAETIKAIKTLSPDKISDDGACGSIPIQGLLLYAKKRALQACVLESGTSADCGGSKARVVGYGSFAFTER